MILREQKCKPCSGDEEPLKNEDINSLLGKLKNGWKVTDDKIISYRFPFDNFKKGMAFANEVALVAENEQHHPDMCIHYKAVEVKLTTHAIGGLSMNDFIMAAKIDEL